LDAKQSDISKQRSTIEEGKYKIDELTKKLRKTEQVMKDKSKEFFQLQISNEVSGSVNSNDYIDEIQDLKLQLGKKDIIIVKHESELKSFRLQINGILVLLMVIELNQLNQLKESKIDNNGIILELQSK
jgi:hypothetical protein